MDSKPHQDPAELAKALVSDFPSYLRGRVEELGIAESSPVSDGIQTATADLAASLRALATQSPHEQVKSPLELVRDATMTVTRALLESGAPTPVRDEWAQDVHPEDIYGLYPASSRDLGEEAWQLHLAWGIDKARLVAGMVPTQDPETPPPSSTTPAMPTVSLFGFDADSRAKLGELLRVRGYRSLIWRNPAALESGLVDSPVLVLVDLTHASAHEAITRLSGNGDRVVAVQDRANDLTIAGILALGADDVLDLARLVRDIDRVLPHIV